MTMEYILTFKNTNSAIKSEQFLLAEKLHVTVMPLPSQIRAGCGISLRLTAEEIGTAVRVLSEKGIEETGLYSRKEVDGKYIYGEMTDRSAL